MDGAGNIATAHSITNSNNAAPVFAGARYAGRLASDPIGTLRAEQTIVTEPMHKVTPMQLWSPSAGAITLRSASTHSMTLPSGLRLTWLVRAGWAETNTYCFVPAELVAYHYRRFGQQHHAVASEPYQSSANRVFARRICDQHLCPGRLDATDY